MVNVRFTGWARKRVESDSIVKMLFANVPNVIHAYNDTGCYIES